MKMIGQPTIAFFWTAAILSAVGTALIAATIRMSCGSTSAYCNVQFEFLLYSYIPMFLGSAFLAGRSIWRKSKPVESYLWTTLMVFVPLWGWHLFFAMWTMMERWR